MSIIDQTWEELGYRVRSINRKVFVRTEESPPMTAGGIWLPPQVQTFYHGYPHQRIVTGTILSAGSSSDVKEGDRVCFKRLHFIRIEKLLDGTFFGCLDALELVGFAADGWRGAETGIEYQDASSV